MKFFTDCSGKCCVCGCEGVCLAGHGDDDFFVASKEKIISILDNGRYPDYTDYMIGFLKKHYGVEYRKQKGAQNG